MGVQTGHRFTSIVLGHQGRPVVTLTDAVQDDPDRFDMATLVVYAAAQCGVLLPASAADQFALCQRRGTIVAVDTALLVRGALLFTPDTVAVSVGDPARAVAAAGRVAAVTPASAGRYTAAALIPGLIYSLGAAGG